MPRVTSSLCSFVYILSFAHHTQEHIHSNAVGAVSSLYSYRASSGLPCVPDHCQLNIAYFESLTSLLLTSPVPKNFRGKEYIVDLFRILHST